MPQSHSHISSICHCKFDRFHRHYRSASCHLTLTAQQQLHATKHVRAKSKSKRKRLEQATAKRIKFQIVFPFPLQFLFLRKLWWFMIIFDGMFESTRRYEPKRVHWRKKTDHYTRFINHIRRLIKPNIHFETLFSRICANINHCLLILICTLKIKHTQTPNRMMCALWSRRSTHFLAPQESQTGDISQMPLRTMLETNQVNKIKTTTKFKHFSDAMAKWFNKVNKWIPRNGKTCSQMHLHRRLRVQKKEKEENDTPMPDSEQLPIAALFSM